MKRIVIASIVIALLVTGATIWSISTRNNPVQAQSECAVTSPTGSAIHFDPSKSALIPAISEAAAITLAKANAAVSINAPEVKMKAQFVNFSDDARGTADKIGDDDSVKLDYQNVPAWVVTFCGVHVPIFVPFDASDARMKDFVGPPETHEWNVVINAITGEYMEEYSFR